MDDPKESPGAEVIQLGKRAKPKPGDGDRVLMKRDMYLSGTCNHRNVTYYIREGETEIECGKCSTKLDPMWVLKILAEDENNAFYMRKTVAEEMKRLDERKQTKCQHCGKLTRISK